MEEKNVESGFKYTYSAKEQDEIKRIRQKYQTQEEDSLTRLRKLDASATSKATAMALIFGVIGSLIFGTGMSFILTDLAKLFGMTGLENMMVGVITGLLGIFLVILAYPIYNKVLQRERDKIAPEILMLTEELMK